MVHSKLEILYLTLIAAVLYCCLHWLNFWVFKQIEFSDHVNWIYLPAFLRLANVLILDTLFGSIATGLGVCLICAFQELTVMVMLPNALASVLSPLFALIIFKIFKHRGVSLHCIRDLIVLALIYALMNTLTHHIAWALVEPEELMNTTQIPIMFFGDLTGACIGAILFAAAANSSGLKEIIKKRI